MGQRNENAFCRLCLSTSVIYYSLLKNNGPEMLKSLTGISMNEESSFSTESCVKCWFDLKLAYNVQQKFCEAEKNFREHGVNSIQSKFIIATSKSASETSKNLSDNIPEISDLLLDPLVKIEYNDEDDGIEKDADDVHEFKELIFIETEVTEADNNNQNNSQKSCFICGVKFETELALNNHTNAHYNDEQCCDLCYLKLPNIPTYRKHIENIHPDSANRTYCCGICPLSFRYMPLYDIHMAAVHPETGASKKRKKDVSKYVTEGNLTCEDCNKNFRSKRAFNAHVKGHLKKPCPDCGTAITVSNLSKHIANHKASSAVCHLCGITMKNPESLRGHMYYTHSQKRLKCELCDRVFNKLYSYKMHIKKEHIGERTFTCDACGKQFFTQYQLNVHFKSRHLKERKHICQYCKKGFASRFSMRTHERQHTNEAPYVCEVCGDGFRQNVSLRAHRKSKHNIIEDKQTECKICSKMFRDDWALKSHVRSVHD